MEQFLIYSHIVCGASVLFLGIIQMLNRKGSSWHSIIGKIYVAAMWWICISALSIISFYRFSAFLMVIAVLTFYASFVGVRVLKRRVPGSEKWYDWMVSILTTLFGIGLLIYGIHIMDNKTIFSILCMIFGSFTAFTALQDLQFYTKTEVENKQWWLRQHISAMGGSYIAAVTAFSVQNPDLIMPNSNHQWLLWLLPGVIGSPIIALVTKKYQKKSNEKWMIAESN